MTYSVVYNTGTGKLVSVTSSNRANGLNPKDITGNGTYALVSKMPKKAANWGTKEIRARCVVKDVLSNNAVELEIIKGRAD